MFPKMWTVIAGGLLLGLAANCSLLADSPPGAVEATLGPAVALRWEEGPISFGLIVSLDGVSWSGPAAKDLLVGRCWSGVFLYPSQSLADQELNQAPTLVCRPFSQITQASPVDFDRDGDDDLIVTDRLGHFYLCPRQGSHPAILFPDVPPEKDHRTGLPFHIPYENPNIDRIDSQGGYINPEYFNYTYPIRYPTQPDKVDLIFGDMAGNLWWLPDDSQGNGRAQYTGVRYRKSDGREWVKPAERISDETGNPFLLGENIDGERRFLGANTRPALVCNPVTGAFDLLVLSGALKQQVFYLKRVNPEDERKPVFRNLGEVGFAGGGFNSPSMISDLVFHSHLTVVPDAGNRNNLLVSCGCRLAFYENLTPRDEVPRYRFRRYASARDASAFLACPTEILRDAEGRRYLLDNTGVKWQFFELKKEEEKLRLGWPGIEVVDQNGPFRVESETDHICWSVWGFHRSARWDFDGSARQHLVVTTDKGHLYLLIEDENTMRNRPFRFRSAGPLKDDRGQVIKIHNRAVAAGIDLNEDAREDLVAGGVSYQFGIAKDPEPGGGYFHLIHRGLDAEGLPILARKEPLELVGHPLELRHRNGHAQLQAIDLDGDGAKEVILADGNGVGHVFRPVPGRPALEFTGKIVPGFSIEHFLGDLDADGQLECFYGGGETGLGHRRKLNFPQDARRR